MSRRIAICLGLLLGGALVILFAPSSPRENSVIGEFHSGDIAGGFQMAIGLDEANGVLHCRIKNASGKRMEYSSFAFGYFENVGLDIQGSTNVLGGGVFPRANGYWGAEPYLPLKIDADGTITNTHWKKQYDPQPVCSLWQYLKWSRFNPGVAIAWEQFARRLVNRRTLLWKACQDDTYVLDLTQVAWPTNLLSQGTLQIKISQRFVTRERGGGFGGINSNAVLYSPVFTVDSARVRSWIEHSPYRR